MSKKIVVLITGGFEDPELTSLADGFRKTGHGMITIERQAGKTMKDREGEANMTIDRSIGEVTPAEFDALLLPDSHSPDYLRGGNRFVILARDFVSSSRPMFVICHSPRLLINADVIRGCKLAAVKPVVINVRDVGAESCNQKVAVDKDQLVTSRTSDDLPALNHETLCLLGA